MKKLTSNLLKLTLFFAASCPIATAAPLTTATNIYDRYSGAITIRNQTPFTLGIIKDFLHHPLKSNAEGNLFLFRSLKPSDQYLEPGERKFIGYTEPQINEIEGYLVLNFLDTEELFTAHYRFGKVQGGDDGSWIKLEQLDNDQPYPLISLRMIRNTIATENLASPGTHYLNAYLLTFSMDDASAACITDPYCLDGHYLWPPTRVPDKSNDKNNRRLKNVEL